MNIVSNFVFLCNNCDTNKVFVKFRENANQNGCRAKNLRLRGRPLPIIFALIDRPMNVLHSVADSFFIHKEPL